MRPVFLAAALALALSVAVSFAADPPRVEIVSVQEQSGRISATVVVYGSDGLPLASLPTGSMRATLDGVSLPITGFQSNTTTRAPLALALVVDVSGSMAGDPIVQARRALTDFVGSLQPDDQVAVFAFDSNVRLLQDFTTDKTAATQAVAKLAPLGDTALYDAVIEASSKIGESPAQRKLVVLLTDGVATVNVGRRAESLAAARNSGATFVSIGLGADIDRAYLDELAGATGGRFLEAPTPSLLKQAYAKLAASIKTQFNVVITVPQDVDRTKTATLELTVNLGATSASAQRVMPPLPGATPPPIATDLTGLAAGMRINSPVSLSPVVPDGVGPVSVEYFLDGESIFKSQGPDLAYQLDPATISKGNHVLKVVVTGAGGRRGEKDVPFTVVGAAASGGVSPTLLMAVAAALAIGGAGIVVVKRRKLSTDGISSRIKPWRGKIPDVTGPLPKAPGEWLQSRLEVPRPPPQPAPPRPLGRLIVIDEAAVKTGGIDAIREYEIGTSPLTLGSTDSCDIVINDPEGRIAGEEARLWVQRGRLVFHKLTTLSAMATEGLTSGWQFLDDGEDITVGPCRISFQLEEQPEAEFAPQELQRTVEIWPMRSDGPPPLGASSD
jgi:VWFA-related protein